MSTSLSGLEAQEERVGRLALTGGSNDFAAFYELHQAKLYNVTYRVSGNPDVAAEATQEAFSRIWAKRDELAARGINATAYLYRIGRNLVLDHHRGRGREVMTDEIDVAAGADASFEADAEAGEMLVAQQLELRDANSRLPEKQRLVLALRELQGLSYDEIAEVMETTSGGVAQLLLRARIALRRELRLGQIDEDRLPGACRALLPEIIALIDDELPGDRRETVESHIAGCAECRAVKAACEEAGQRYRAWLPLMGFSTAWAAPWLVTAAVVSAATASGPSGRTAPMESAKRHPRRVALMATAAILVIAVPLALPALTAREEVPVGPEEEVPLVVGPCPWCERLDDATTPGGEPAPVPGPVTVPVASSAAPPAAPTPRVAGETSPAAPPTPTAPARPAVPEGNDVASPGTAPGPRVASNPTTPSGDPGLSGPSEPESRGPIDDPIDDTPQGDDPSTGGDDPSPGGDDPNTGGDDPNTGGDDPTTGGDDPSTGGDDPSTGGDDPSTGGDDPTGGNDPNGNDPTTGTPGGDNPGTDANGQQPGGGINSQISPPGITLPFNPDLGP